MVHRSSSRSSLIYLYDHIMAPWERKRQQIFSYTEGGLLEGRTRVFSGIPPFLQEIQKMDLSILAHPSPYS